MASQWQHMRFTYTEANLLPDDHPYNLEYNEFLDIFGEEGNLIVLGVKDSTLFTPENFNAWMKLSQELQAFDEVELSLSVGDLKKLQKRKDAQEFELVPFIDDTLFTPNTIARYKHELFNKLPFYEGLIYNPAKNSVRTALYLDKSIVNTFTRRDFILSDLIPKIEAFEAQTNIEVHTSGMPYIRTLNSKNIVDEISLFIGAAMLITSLIFFFFFRSYRATFISLVTVLIGVMWSFGFLGLMHYEITVLTALIPT
jgi:predicted RND superfamily exporter protein